MTTIELAFAIDVGGLGDGENHDDVAAALRQAAFRIESGAWSHSDKLRHSQELVYAVIVHYANPTAKLNPHDDRNAVTWPKRQMAF